MSDLSVNQPSQIQRISPSELEMLEKLGSNWRLTPATFAYHLSRGRWIPAPWLMYVSQIIAGAIARGGGRIIISAPPRHGKSELVDVYTPAWVMENFSGYHTILASYGSDLSVGFGRRVRDMLIDNEDILTTRVRRDVKKAAFFQCENGSSMAAVGVGGPITGRGAHVLLIDDYVKEIKEALSPTYRNYVWDWFSTTAFTRLEPGGTCIIIATRWHSDDLIGRILKTFPGMWTNIALPAIAEKGDILGRIPGEPLFPERYPTEVLEERLEVLGGAYFQALFQQRPIDDAKKLADSSWLKLINIVPAREKLIMARVWDLAATEDGGDFTVGALCGFDRTTGFLYVLDVIRRQLSPGDVERLVLATAQEDGYSVKVGIEKEGASSGKFLVEHFKRNVLPDFKVEEIAVAGRGAKTIRAQPFLAACEAGKVFLRIDPVWNKGFITEFDSFPGDYDDQVDAVAGAYTLLSGRHAWSATWGLKKGAGGKAKPINSKNLDYRVREMTERRVTALETEKGPTTGATWGRRR